MNKIEFIMSEYEKAKKLIEKDPIASGISSRRCLEGLFNLHMNLGIYELKDAEDILSKIGFSQSLIKKVKQARLLGNKAAHPTSKNNPYNIRMFNKKDAIELSKLILEIINDCIDYLHDCNNRFAKTFNKDYSRISFN